MMLTGRLLYLNFFVRDVNVYAFMTALFFSFVLTA